MIDAVASKLHVFHDPSADGYRTTRTSQATTTVTPLVAPASFALRLADLDVRD